MQHFRNNNKQTVILIIFAALINISAKAYPYMDVALGVKFLHDQGLTGKDVTVGVIDTVGQASDNVGIIKGFKKSLMAESDPFSLQQECHSSHVTGIICGRKIEGKVAVAPDSKVLFKANLPAGVLSRLPIKCEVTAVEDWDFKEGTIFAGNKVIVHQPQIRLNRLKPSTEIWPYNDYVHYIFNKKEYTPKLNDEEIADRHPAVYACTGLYGDARSAFSKDLYPGYVTHYEYVGNETDDHISKLIEYFDEKQIRIINFSLTVSFGQKTINALHKFANNGGVFVVAAGNEDTALTARGYLNTKYIVGKLFSNKFATLLHNFPKSVLLVGNLDTTAEGEPFRLNRLSTKAGDLKDHYISAWGTNVPSITYKEGPSGVEPQKVTSTMTGTSQAAPMVSGIIADLYQGFSHCTPLEIKDILLRTASKENLSGPADNFGAGVVDAKAAYGYLKQNGCK